MNSTERAELTMELTMGQVKRVGAIDANKAYASNMLKTGCVVKFPPYSGFVSKSVKISKYQRTILTRLRTTICTESLVI